MCSCRLSVRRLVHARTKRKESQNFLRTHLFMKHAHESLPRNFVIMIVSQTPKESKEESHNREYLPDKKENWGLDRDA